MIRNLKDTAQKNTEQDWLQDQPLAKFTRMLQGPAHDLMTVTKLILSELAPVVSAQHGVFYMMEQSDGEPVLRLHQHLCLPRAEGASATARGSPWARAWSASAAAFEEGADPHRRRSRATTSGSAPGLGGQPPAEHCRPAGPVRGERQGRDRAGLLPSVQGDPPQPARSAHRDDRHRAQHDRRQHADRVSAHAVAIARRGADQPAGGAEGDQHPPREAGGDPQGVGGAAPGPAGLPQEGQRGAGDQGRPAHDAERPGRGGQNRGDRGQWPSWQLQEKDPSNSS